MMNFTNDEMNLMCIYQSDSRSGLIAALTEMRGYLDEDEAQLRNLTDSALQKLGEITDEDFAELEHHKRKSVNTEAYSPRKTHRMSRKESALFF